MIPKVIHYCWFGHNPLPKSARKCIASWRKYFSDYEIKEWNEGNFNVSAIPYTRVAYQQKKYAFVSDYARFYILYKYGGLYFDTDVEVIRPMDDLITQGAFMGIEQDRELIGVAPGLGLGAEPGMPLYEEILIHYKELSFLDETGKQIPGTVVMHTTRVLQRHGFLLENRLQDVCGIRIYPNEYFNPLDDATGVLNVTSNTRSIHWYAKTWVNNYGPFRIWITRWIHRVFGIKSISWLKRYIHIQ